MDGHSINRIRNASFSHAVRGYDRHEVDQFLNELANWLAGEGEGEADSEQLRAELARVGEQVAGILTEAHDAAEEIRNDATSEVRQRLVNANLAAESLSTQAGEYAEETRQETDAYARKVRADADAYAARIREEADSSVADARETAEREGERILEDASRRKRDTEAVISDLEERRDAVLAELERLASGIAGAATEHRGGRNHEAEAEQEAEAEAVTEPRNAG